MTRPTSVSARLKVLRNSATRASGDICFCGAAPIRSPSCLSNQVAITRRYQLLLVGRNLQRMILVERHIDVGRGGARRVHVEHQLAAVGRGHDCLRQSKQDVTCIMNRDRGTMLARLIETLVGDRSGELAKVRIALRAALSVAGITAGLGSLRLLVAALTRLVHLVAALAALIGRGEPLIAVLVRFEPAALVMATGFGLRAGSTRMLGLDLSLRLRDLILQLGDLLIGLLLVTGLRIRIGVGL